MPAADLDPLTKDEHAHVGREFPASSCDTDEDALPKCILLLSELEAKFGLLKTRRQALAIGLYFGLSLYST